MRKFFKSRSPKHRAAMCQPVTTQADIITAHAWDLTLTQWWALSDFERAECRRNIVTAPRFVP